LFLNTKHSRGLKGGGGKVNVPQFNLITLQVCWLHTVYFSIHILKQEKVIQTDLHLMIANI